jgi:phosphoribosylanthranilate isomerase
MTKIKICGLTREEDAAYAADCGADFLGMIFVAASPRCIDIERATSIARAADSRAKLVGVFRDQSPSEVRDIASRVGLDFVQLHGGESDADIIEIGVPTFKTISVGETLPDTTAHPHAGWMLFDSPGGGTGRSFDWSLLALYERKKPFLLAGGITADNVAAAISLVRPDAIDVASGVESAPGIKDHEKIRQLIERVKRA